MRNASEPLSVIRLSTTERPRFRILEQNYAWTRQVLQQVTNTLSWLHENSMAHRNLLPQHIFVDDHGNVILCEYEYFASERLLHSLEAVTMERSLYNEVVLTSL
ncbi:hypothetical protein PHET_11922 [Paragonimus heterotremus]|uniref:Protein kinase domain-containing protein n=1 Tax=Paragonimus heterotremus TaxID=100268 RepID=A0A8J4SZD4_9TREM|nr:hypothetical protein PHET_11922 [Paragonimus heterotremus]